MTQITQDRIDFIEQLHEVFCIRKGRGAFAYITVSDAMSLYETYLDSTESLNLFVNRFVRSIE